MISVLDSTRCDNGTARGHCVDSGAHQSLCQFCAKRNCRMVNRLDNGKMGNIEMDGSQPCRADDCRTNTILKCTNVTLSQTWKLRNNEWKLNSQAHAALAIDCVRNWLLFVNYCVSQAQPFLLPFITALRALSESKCESAVIAADNYLVVFHCAIVIERVSLFRLSIWNFFFCFVFRVVVAVVVAIVWCSIGQHSLMMRSTGKYNYVWHT